MRFVRSDVERNEISLEGILCRLLTVVECDIEKP